MRNSSFQTAHGASQAGAVMRRRYFITATGTDIGKTYLSAALIHSARAAGKTIAAFKPIMSGFDPRAPELSDAGQLLAALDWPACDLESISPWRYVAPLAPSMAAAKENRPLDFNALMTFSRAALHHPADIVLVEGVGGVMAPLTHNKTVLDWIEGLAAPAIMLAGSYLGAISHCLTAIEVLQRRSMPIAAVIVNESLDAPIPLTETAAEIQGFLASTPVIAFQRGADAAEIYARLASA